MTLIVTAVLQDVERTAAKLELKPHRKDGRVLQADVLRLRTESEAPASNLVTPFMAWTGSELAEAPTSAGTRGESA